MFVLSATWLGYKTLKSTYLEGTLRHFCLNSYIVTSLLELSCDFCSYLLSPH